MRPGVIVLSDDAFVLQGQRSLIAHGVHAVLVIERFSGRPVGWATSRGLLSRCDRDTSLASVPRAVTEPAVVTAPSASAREALDTLEREGATRCSSPISTTDSPKASSPTWTSCASS